MARWMFLVLNALDTFKERWKKIFQPVRSNWGNLSPCFKYLQEARRLIYTTNAIESFSRKLRKTTKARSVFPTDDSLLKMLCLTRMNITKKWAKRRQSWSLIHAKLAVYLLSLCRSNTDAAECQGLPRRFW